MSLLGNSGGKRGKGGSKQSGGGGLVSGLGGLLGVAGNVAGTVAGNVLGTVVSSGSLPIGGKGGSSGREKLHLIHRFGTGPKRDSRHDLQLLFQRPREPLFSRRGAGKIAFDIPAEFLTKRYRPIGQSLMSGHSANAERMVSLKKITVPNLEFAAAVPKTGAFSLFNRRHQEVAGELIKIFLETPDCDTLLSTAAYCKDRVNPYLFQYALNVCTQHRNDTNDIQVPSVVQQFPNQFVDSSVFPKCREEATLVAEGDRMPIQIPPNFTASEREMEQRIAYFREDIGVNMHHWHWHLVYPGEGPEEIVRKDRRGELFYFMHSQLIARYNLERLCNGLPRVKALTNLREPVIEGYFPKIIRSTNNRAYPSRVDRSMLSDLNRADDEVVVALGDLERWRDRILQAIDQGFVIEDGTGRQIPLDEQLGIDILGNIVEASRLSPNRKLYGSLHNEGHNILAYVHDPEGRHLEDYAVMGDVATAMRDPIFYRWHSFIESIFVKYKSTLPIYTAAQLNFDGINVDSVKVQISASAAGSTSGKTPKAAAAGQLATHWQRSSVDLAAGLDFGPGNVFAQFTHLQHKNFEFRISVTNNSQTARQGTCRIFLGPKTDERGQTLKFREQRALMVELDKFIVNLNPGPNDIRRKSVDSNVTIPYERSFRRLGNPAETPNLAQFQFCGCGWPQHMMLPKGSIEGAQYEVFVMISNYTQDRIDQDSDL